MDNLLLKKRYQSVAAARSPIEGIWDLVERFVVPFTSKVYGAQNNEAEVEWRKRDIYDGTAIEANEELASTIQAGLINFAFRWFDFVWRNKVLQKDKPAKDWLQEASEITFQMLQDSNFELEASETIHALPSYGSGPTVEEVEEDVDGSFLALNFSSVPVHESYFEEDHNGRPLFFYRLRKWTAVQIMSKFGEDNLPEKVKAAYEKASQDRFDVLFAIYPRSGKVWKGEKVMAPLERPFGFKYIYLESAQTLGEEGGYFEMPVFIPRWRKTAGSQWGYSPAMVCMSDILTLNQLVELVLTSAEKVVDPPILGTRRGVFGNVDLTAGGYTVVQDEKSIRPFESGARFDVSALTKDDLQKAIRSAFFVDKIELKQSPEMTATEVQARLEQLARLMLPTLARIQTDFLDLVLKRTFRILYRYGMFPELPQSVKDIRAELDIEYRGPMARAQKMDKVMSIERWMATITQLSDRYPEMGDVPDGEKVSRDLGDLLGVPSDLMNSKGVTTMIQRQRAEITQLRQQVETMKTGGEGFRAAAQGMAAFRGGENEERQAA
jgi:hypothetical protein